MGFLTNLSKDTWISSGYWWKVQGGKKRNEGDVRIGKKNLAKEITNTIWFGFEILFTAHKTVDVSK